MPNVLNSTLIGLLLLSLTACSSFNRDWRKASKSESTGVSGRWEGSWSSVSSGHSGKLRCLLTPISENTYQARYHARYAKVLRFSYAATLTGYRTNDVFYFSGDADLGRLAGGIYTYEGKANSTNFFSTYKSKYDNGTFQMRRPD